MIFLYRGGAVSTSQLATPRTTDMPDNRRVTSNFVKTLGGWAPGGLPRGRALLVAKSSACARRGRVVGLGFGERGRSVHGRWVRWGARRSVTAGWSEDGLGGCGTSEDGLCAAVGALGEPGWSTDGRAGEVGSEDGWCEVGEPGRSVDSSVGAVGSQDGLERQGGCGVVGERGRSVTAGWVEKRGRSVWTAGGEGGEKGWSVDGSVAWGPLQWSRRVVVATLGVCGCRQTCRRAERSLFCAIRVYEWRPS